MSSGARVPPPKHSHAALGGATLSIVRVQRKAIGGVVLAAALVIAVVSLRGQVEPAASGPTAEPMPLTTTPNPPALPLRSAERTTQWRTYELPAGAMIVKPDPEHIVVGSVTEPTGPEPEAVLTVRSRDGSGQELSYRSQPAGWWPVDWQILNGALYVIEISGDESVGLGGARLMRVDLGNGRFEQIPVRSVQPLWPRLPAVDEQAGPGRRSLLTFGDELIAIGTNVKNPAEQCAIAIRPSTRAERIVACGVGPPVIEPADGGVLIRLPDNSPNGCSVRLLMPGSGEFGLPVFIGYCQQRQIIPLDGWRAYLTDGPESANPLLATNGTDRVMLGMVKMVAVSCHGRLYWMSGGGMEPFGTEVLRWTPGASEVEVVRRSRGETVFGLPTCDGGTLGVPVHGSAVDGYRVLDLLVLDRP
jgi:hypothetical protein